MLALLIAFVALTLFAAFALTVVAPRDLPPITGTVALVMTLAALGVAVLH